MRPCANSASAITPIVFCASFAPCVKPIHVPDASWPSRKERFATPGVSRWKAQKIARSSGKPPANAIVGAQIAGITTLCVTPCQSTPLVPAGVGCLLELLVDVLPANDRQRVPARAEQLGDGLA